MIPIALRIRNFRSFQKEQVFSFPKEPGLYFMQGVNEVEPRLQGNGVGKSGIWDALSWCAFGKTTRGLKAGEVANWAVGEDVHVNFIFMEEIGGRLWNMTRTWKPNSWTLEDSDEGVKIDLAKDPANPVLAALRLDYDAFLQSILMAQGRDMFLDLKQEPQAALFSTVLGLERWMGWSSDASKRASAQDSISRDMERRMSKVEGELDGMGRQDHTKRSEDWERDRAERAADLDNRHQRLLAQRKGLKLARDEAQANESRVRKALGASQVDPELLEREKELHADLQASRDLLNRLKGKAEDMAPQLEEMLADLEHCPTCGQGWPCDGKRITEVAEELTARAETLHDQVHTEEALQKKLASKLEKVEHELERQEKAEARAKDDLDAVVRSARNAQRDLEQCDQDLDRLEDQAEIMERERNPYKDMQKEAAQAEDKLREELGRVRAELDESVERYGLLSYWVKGFKEVRLQQIAEALTELEIEVNSCVTALGLVDWELRFAVDKETQKGSIQRGFSVQVRSPHNPFATPWEAWSGGESQRLRVAANMGLADLVRSRSGIALNLEVWDEPTNGLSPQGVTDLLEALAARARIEQRVIFLVDHQAYDFGGFAGLYTIVKAPSGTRIRQGAV